MSEESKKILDTLKELGVPANLRGHLYLSKAVELCRSNKDYMYNITKMLYPEIAKEYNTTSSRVERAIRHAIETAFDRISADLVYKYFGNTVRAHSGKATNSEFIATLVHML